MKISLEYDKEFIHKHSIRLCNGAKDLCNEHLRLKIVPITEHKVLPDPFLLVIKVISSSCLSKSITDKIKKAGQPLFRVDSHCF